MKIKTMLFGAGALVIALVFTFLNLTKIEIFSDKNFFTNINIYPAGFFALLGLLLIYRGLKK